MVAEMVAHEFDPLVEFYGAWTTELAGHYLPVPWVPPGMSYECVDGYLIMSPYEGTANVHAADVLVAMSLGAAAGRGHRAYSTVNVSFTPVNWIQPDITIVREPVRAKTWVPATNVLLVGECVSPSSRRRDRIDKPRLCAEAGIPFYLRVEIADHKADVELLRLVDGIYQPFVRARNGQRFATDEPIPLDFDPVILLED